MSLLYKVSDIMKKIHLVHVGVMTALLGSNLIIGYQYNKDSQQYEKEIQHQNKLISYNKNEIVKLNMELKQQQEKLHKVNQVVKKKDSQIHSLEKRLQNAEKNSESPMRRLTVKPTVKKMPSRGTVSQQRKLNVIATAYISKCYKCLGITKAGIDVRNTILHEGMRIIATDPQYIKLHSIVKVETETESFMAYVADTGGRIRGYKIDVLISVDDEQKAFEFGKQPAVITIIREGEGIDK